jgi:hypothetical protein
LTDEVPEPTIDLLVEEVPRGAMPGARPVRSPLVQLVLLAPSSSSLYGSSDLCTLPQPFGALVLRMVPAPSGPGKPLELVQEFDKQVDKITRHLTSFECRVAGSPAEAKKLAG